MKRLTRRKGRALLIAAASLAVALSVVLAILLAADAAERRRLEEERRKNENDQTIVTTTPATPPSLLSGYGLLSEGISDFSLVYFGDASIFGHGASDFYGAGNDTAAYPYRLQIRTGLREAYGAPGGFVGHVYPYADPSFELGLADLLASYDASYLNYRLAVLAPGGANAGNAAGSTFGRGFAADLESMIRGIRSSLSYCDILLVVPHTATPTEAESILALASHYGLVAVDARTVFATDPTLTHTEGEYAGLPNDRGHTAYAEAVLAAISAAVEGEHTMPSLPGERLY